MSPDLQFLLVCLVFSFICAFIKQLYDARFSPKRSLFALIIDISISGIAGIVTTLMLFEYVQNRITLMGISGLGGMFGLTVIRMIMKFQLGKKIKIQIGMEDDDGIVKNDLLDDDKLLNPTKTQKSTDNKNHQ